MNAEKKGQEYQFKLVVAGKEFLTGDESSVAVVFYNLTGSNYAGKPHQEYLDYMAWMEHYYDFLLSGEIQMLDPEGVVLERGVIGEAIITEALNECLLADLQGDEYTFIQSQEDIRHIVDDYAGGKKGDITGAVVKAINGEYGEI